MRLTRTALALMVGVVAGPTALTAQSHNPMEDSAAGPAGMGRDVTQMTGMCEQMSGRMGMMSGQGMMGGQSMMSGPGMMGPQPMMLLKQREALGLSADQIERLEAMKERASVHRASRMTEMRRFDEDVAAATGEDTPDLARLETMLSKQAQGHVRMRVGQARMAQEALSVLTVEQRSNLRYGMQLMQSMMRSMHGAGAEADADSGPHQHDGTPR